jgi:alpha-L-fucosidase
MSRPVFCLAVLSLLSIASTAPAPAGAQSSSNASPVSQDDRMSWWRDARFGMFIHWGLYSIPAGEWPPRDKDGKSAPNAKKDHAEWIRETAQIPVAEYEKLQPQFNPVKFDPDLWATMAADAGMKYLVITSKHHDGFCLFDSKWTDWDVMGTPFHRDILAELSAACAKHGVRFCTYHSIMDWHHPDYLPRRSWEKTIRPEGGADFAKFEEYLHHEVEEVVTKYHPGVMWFDGEWESTWSHDRGLSLYELCRKLDPKMIVNNRVDVHRGGMGGFSESKDAVGDFATPEQEIPATGMPGLDWETCMTMNDHWGFNAADKNWKTTEDLVRKLADIASKGGNFLLNIGPRSDGTFPPEAVSRLAEIGAWMKVNGESIRGTTASPFDALAFGRCTVSAGIKGEMTRLYLHVFDWPKDRKLVIPGLGNEIGRAYLLAKPKEDLSRAREGSDVQISLPEAAPDPLDSVVVLESQGAPIVYKAPVIEAESEIFVNPMKVKIPSSSPALEVHFTLDGTEPGAASPVYREEIVVTATTTVRARSFHDGKPVSAAVSARFDRVEPRPGQPPNSTELAAKSTSRPGIVCTRFEGDWDQVPDLNSIKAALVGSVNGIELVTPTADELKRPLEEQPVNRKSEHAALKFVGTFLLDASDVYTFELTSDDGSRLWIDDQLAVDNDGLHSSQAKRGRIALGAGWHRLVVGWFNKSGGAELSLKCGALGAPLGPVPLRPRMRPSR